MLGTLREKVKRGRSNVGSQLASSGPRPGEPRHHHEPRPRAGAAPPGPAPARDGGVRPVSGAGAGARPPPHGSSGQGTPGQSFPVRGLQGKSSTLCRMSMILIVLLCHKIYTFGAMVSVI